MIIFRSEICRLILGFLESEELYRSYTTFLNECKWLDECRIYLEKGIQFSTKIQGKDLMQYLSDCEQVETVNCMTQTDELGVGPNSEYSQISNTNDTSTQTEYVADDDNLKLNQEQIENLVANSLAFQKNELKIEDDLCASFKPKIRSCNKRKKNRSSFVRKKSSVLDTPTKKNRRHLHDDNDCESSSDPENNDIDIDFFINNLCENDFAAQLANGINNFKASKKFKSNSSESTKSENEKPILKYQDINEYKSSEQLTENSLKKEKLKEITPSNKELSEPSLDPNLASILNMGDQKPINEHNSDFGLFDLNLNPVSIGNEEISYLADYFSEPACETLYQVMGSSTATILNPHNQTDVDNILKTSDPILKDPLTSNDTAGVEPFEETANEIKINEPSVSISSDRKSMIVIAKSRQDLDKVERELKQSDMIINTKGPGQKYLDLSLSYVSESSFSKYNSSPSTAEPSQIMSFSQHSVSPSIELIKNNDCDLNTSISFDCY